jgi:hypothetical protein
VENETMKKSCAREHCPNTVRGAALQKSGSVAQTRSAATTCERQLNGRRRGASDCANWGRVFCSGTARRAADGVNVLDGGAYGVGSEGSGRGVPGGSAGRNGSAESAIWGILA